MPRTNPVPRSPNDALAILRASNTETLHDLEEMRLDIERMDQRIATALAIGTTDEAKRPTLPPFNVSLSDLVVATLQVHRDAQIRMHRTTEGLLPENDRAALTVLATLVWTIARCNGTMTDSEHPVIVEADRVHEQLDGARYFDAALEFLNEWAGQ